MLIALSLTAILLTFLFSFLVESAKLEKKLDGARFEIASRQHLQTRVQAVLTSIRRDSTVAPFYTKALGDEKNESLIALFDNGIDPDPAFSGPVLGRIYLDGDQNLALAIWPLDKIRKKKAWRKEILLSHVNDFELEFMAKKKEMGKIKPKKTKPIHSSLEWRSDWPSAGLGIPAVVRLRIWEKGIKDPLRFAFLIPSSEPIATYPEAT